MGLRNGSGDHDVSGDRNPLGPSSATIVKSSGASPPDRVAYSKKSSRKRGANSIVFKDQESRSVMISLDDGQIAPQAADLAGVRLSRGDLDLPAVNGRESDDVLDTMPSESPRHLLQQSGRYPN